MAEAEVFEEFFRQHCQKELMAAAAKGRKSVEIDFSLLERFDHRLAEKLLNDPAVVLDEARRAMANIDLPEGSVKLEPRFKNLPKESTVRIRNLRADHMGKLICVEGVVRRASEVRPEIYQARFKCPACGTLIDVEQKERIVRPPSFCECGNKTGFTMVDKRMYDMRWLTIEEPFDVATAERPGTINVYLRDDLTTPEMHRKTDPGNRLKIGGIVKEIRKFTKAGAKTQLDIFIEANHIEPTEIEWEEVNVTPEDERKIMEMAADPDIYKKIVDSIATSMYGMDEVKEAIAYQLFGGVPQHLADGTRVRGDIHILLLGDPSVGKTQLLKLVSKIIPRGKYVSGKGVTGVGLTASVTKDEEFMGGWVLEAGAMVLCHKGIIAIDEFDKMHKDDQVAMHEAMSTQTISVAKATIVATLPSQTAVLAGANPKYSRFDPFKSTAEQTDIPDTLLSRFDLKFALRDVPDKAVDERIADHVMDARLSPDVIKPAIDTDLLRKYIAYARHNCFPKMTPEAAERIKNFYITMRNMYAGQGGASIPITLRQYEALIRLAEAAAKIRLSKKVEVQDAERVIKIMEYSIRQLGFDAETGKIDIDKTEGVSSSQRNKLLKVIDVIEKLEKTIGRPVPIEEVKATAQDEGISERDVEDLVQRLKKEGVIFEPKSNYIQKV
ncbi:MAG: minichromosome maintenance protein MCM [Candidatus Aenigmatarchaeota archaeon]